MARVEAGLLMFFDRGGSSLVFFDRDGNTIGLTEWTLAFESMAYRRVAESRTPNGNRVSTVWLGLNHQFGEGAPLIFETMVFRDGEEVACYRYATLAEAEVGHVAAVAEWSVDA